MLMPYGKWSVWVATLQAAFGVHHVPGPDLDEWLRLMETDFDDIDAEYYQDTIGG